MQLNRHSETSRHCNFSILSGDVTGTFKTEFYVLTDMPAEIQKAFDTTLRGLTNTYDFFADDSL